MAISAELFYTCCASLPCSQKDWLDLDQLTKKKCILDPKF